MINEIRIKNFNRNLIIPLLLMFLFAGMACEKKRHSTAVSIVGDKWYINGNVTCPETRAEGLLMNVRMVNAVFEDRNRDDFYPDENTNRFIDKIPEYMGRGILAFTINLQGGMPGYEGALNTAYEEDGTLRESYLIRVSKVIENCDRLGAVVILGCFYQRQDQYLSDADAVRNAVMNVTDWLKDSGYTNVLLEISNEFGHGGFDHSILKTPEGQVELIKLAKDSHSGLLVSTSGLGNGKFPDIVAQVCDFPIIHFNNTPVDSISIRVEAIKKYGKPILCNEDNKTGDEGAQAAEMSVDSECSWGLMLSAVNQYQPFEFNGHADDPLIYDKLKKLTSR